jgi:hypothetical protein
MNPLFLFLYHKNDLITKINYEQLCKIEGEQNVQPISDCQSYLKNTYRADEGIWEFPHWDSYWMCDGLIYKYILNNKNKVRSKSAIIIIEYDTWWNTPSYKWLNFILNDFDIVGPELLEINKNPSWDFFKKHQHLSFSKDLVGLRPFTAIVCKPESIINTAEYIKNNTELHKVYNNEMRFATACKLSGSKIGVLPESLKENIKWHQWNCNNMSPKETIVHPIKKYNQVNIEASNLSIVTSSYYNSEIEINESTERLKKTLEKFNIELKIFSGLSKNSLQEIKIYQLRKDLEKINTEYTIYVDAKDVICVTNPIPKIKLLDYYNKKVILSTEITCWPEEHLKSKFPYTKHKSAYPNYKHLNSGVILARTKDFIEHLDILISMMEDKPELKQSWRTDQNIWQYLFIEQDKHGASLALDTDTNLSLSTFYIPVGSIVETEENNIKIPMFTVNNGKPSFLHFNGPDKHDTNRINENTKKWLNI